MTHPLFNPRVPSLARGNILVLGSLCVAILISGIPHFHSTLWLIVPSLVSMVGTADTLRCIQRRWSFYHGGVILCLYMDLMAVSMVLFLLLYPYFPPLLPHR